MLQVYEPGKGLAFHFDKDEHAMKERHQMLQPVLSSVLYLTGESTAERLGKLHRHYACFVLVKSNASIPKVAICHNVSSAQSSSLSVLIDSSMHVELDAMY